MVRRKQEEVHNSQNVNWGHKSIQYYKPHSAFCGVFCFCEFGEKYEKIGCIINGVDGRNFH